MKLKAIMTGALAAVLLAGCGSGGKASAPVVRPVKVYRVEPLGAVDKDFAGMSTADSVSNLAFRVSGQIIKVYVQDGQTVRQGAIIAEIDPREYRLQMEADKATFLTARSQMDRNKRLLDRQAISRQDYEIADAAYVRARSAYNNSQSILADTKLRAPFSGAIEKMFVDNFQRVQVGEPVARLVDPLTRTVKYTMPETALQMLKMPGLSFTVWFDAYQNTPFPARLKEYMKSSTQATGISVALTLEPFDEKRYDIAPGMSCTINMKVESPQHDTVTAVPLTAVFSRDNREWVWIVGTDRRVKAQPVKLGQLFDLLGRRSRVTGDDRSAFDDERRILFLAELAERNQAADEQQRQEKVNHLSVIEGISGKIHSITDSIRLVFPLSFRHFQTFEHCKEFKIDR